MKFLTNYLKPAMKLDGRTSATAWYSFVWDRSTSFMSRSVYFVAVLIAIKRTTLSSKERLGISALP